MRPRIKKRVLDLSILLIPILFMLLMTPLLPNNLLIYKGLNGDYFDRHFAFLLGILPYAIYKLKFEKK